MKPLSSLIIVLFFPLLLFCTKDEKKNYEWDEYDLNKPETYFLSESLLEISGLTFHQDQPDTMYAVQDEKGSVYKLTLGSKKFRKTKFNKKGDYEDIAILGDEVFVLKSNGTIFSFPFEDLLLTETERTVSWKDLFPKGEYESIFANQENGKIYVLCKKCKGKGGKKSITGYGFNPSKPRSKIEDFKIKLPKKLHDDKSFNASAVAQNPITKEFYIVSSIQKTLLIVDENLDYKKSFSLKRKVFNQPESIAFDKFGNMYISNEGDKYQKANILYFERSK